MQRALEEGSEDVRASVASELRGHIWEMLRCPHASHVLQKCVATLSPRKACFIADELLAAGPQAVAQAARHRYACRVLQRLMEHLPPEDMSAVADEILEDAIGLCEHPFGNYVVGQLLDFGTEEQRRRLFRALQQNVSAVASCIYAQPVLEKALDLASGEQQLAIGRAILAQPGLLATMASSKHGSSAVRLLLQELTGPEHDEACRQLAEAEWLEGCRYGRAVMSGPPESP